ncbi:MAG: CHAT domain-containing protein [Syntrophobacteraceae bacterium]|jgi:hypothetical protein|nr:CHAT domain-containing protein [Syntrophobacteraceae bacterium]
MTAINWLHLTDLHIGSEKIRQATIQELFFEDLEQVFQHQLGPIDLVLFTGDLVFKGARHELQEADTFVQRLLDTLERLGSPRPVFLPVPGNHDLVRPDVADLEGLIKWSEEVRTNFWEKEAGLNRLVVSRAFENYMNWWEPYREDYRVRLDLKDGLLPGDFSCTYEKEGARVGIVGLNTSFLQLTDDETFRVKTGGRYEGSLAVSARQYQVVGGRGWAKDRHLCLLLTHHSQEWLSPECRNEFNKDIFDPNLFAAHLFGHMHAARYWATAQGGGRGRRSFQGKSLFGLERFYRVEDDRRVSQEDRMHGYALGRIEFSEDLATLRIWPRRAWEPGDTWRFGPDYESYELNQELRGHHTKAEPIELSGRFVAPTEATRAVEPKDGDVQLTLTVKGRKVLVEEAPGVRGEIEMSSPVLEAVGLLRDRLVQKSIDPYAQQVLGKLLFRALFNGEVGKLFEETLARVKKPGRLRLHLNFGLARDLAGLPWEFMYHTSQEKPSGYLSSAVDMCLSRLCVAKPELQPAGRPMKVFVVVAKLDPGTVNQSEHAFDEKPVLKAIREHPQFNVVECDPPTRTRFIDELENLGDQYLLHFIGYGRLGIRGERDEDRYLEVGFLPEAHKGADWSWMSEDVLAQVFQTVKVRIPHLVFLQLCGCPATQIAILAQKLITVGVPFVVAMQHRISDDAAALFAAKFYQAVADGQPVSVAVQAGRTEIATKTGSVDVGTPVIYLSTDSPLLPQLPPMETEPARTYQPGQTPTPSGAPEGERKHEPSQVSTAERGYHKRPPIETPSPREGQAAGRRDLAEARIGPKPPAAETPVRVIGEMRKAGFQKARELGVEDQARQALSRMNFRDDPASLCRFLEDLILGGEEVELIDVYQVMLDVLKESEGGNP